MSPVCVEIYIFRGSVSFLMSVILDSNQNPHLLLLVVLATWPHRLIGEQNSKQTTNAKVWIKVITFSKKYCTSARSVQILSNSIYFSLFLRGFFPSPSECLAHGNLKEKKTCGSALLYLHIWASVCFLWSVSLSRINESVKVWMKRMNGNVKLQRGEVGELSAGQTLP